MDIPGLLGRLAGLPGAINQGLLGSMPVDPRLGIDPQMLQQARQGAGTDFAMGLVAGGNDPRTLLASRRGATEGFRGRVFDLLKEQETSRMMADRDKREKAEAALRSSLPPEMQQIYDVAGPQAVASRMAELALGSESGGGGIGNFNPGDYTPASFATFMQSRNPADLVRWVTPSQEKVVVIAGVPHVVKGGMPVPLSSLDEEAQAQATLAQARTQGQGEGQLAVEAPKRNEQRRLAYTAMGNTRAAVQGARDLVSPLTTGIGGAVTGVIPGTSAVDLRKKIDTIKANLGFAELSAMRQSSPTGGALGQVAVQELEMLQSTVASLDTLQSSGALLEALNKVDQHLNNWQAAVDKAAARDGQSAPDPLGIR